jgi:transposase
VIIVKTFRHYDSEQVHLLPEDPRKWLPPDHLAFFVDDVVDKLDLSAITRPYEAEERGYPPYHPVMMVKVLIYAYCVGVFSSRRIMHHLREDIAFRVISGNNQPDFRTVSEFRRRHLAALEGLFVQVLRLCMEAGLVKLGHVSIDGTKVMANASRHKAMSYGRMKKQLDKLREEARALLAEAERVDEEEDALYGDRSGLEMPEGFADPKRRRRIIGEAMEAIKRADAEADKDAGPEEEGKGAGPEEGGQRGGTEASSGTEPNRFTGLGDGELMEELVRRTGRMERILEGKHALEERARENTEEKGDGARGSPTPKDMPKPEDKDQYNFTDPESRIMPSSANKKAFIQAYNAQLAVDAAHHIIVAFDTSNCPVDTPQLAPMVARMEAATGMLPDRMSLDAGYFSDENLEFLEGLDIDAYIASQRQKHGDVQPPAPRGRIPKDLSRADRMRRKMRTKRGKKVYSRRKAIAEPPIGHIKQARGFRQFLLRGGRAVRGEWGLVCMTHNVLRWYEVVRRAT